MAEVRYSLAELIALTVRLSGHSEAALRGPLRLKTLGAWRYALISAAMIHGDRISQADLARALGRERSAIKYAVRIAKADPFYAPYVAALRDAVCDALGTTMQSDVVSDTAAAPTVTLDQVLSAALDVSGCGVETFTGPSTKLADVTWRCAALMAAVDACPSATMTEIGAAFRRTDGAVNAMLLRNADNPAVLQRKRAILTKLGVESLGLVISPRQPVSTTSRAKSPDAPSVSPPPDVGVKNVPMKPARVKKVRLIPPPKTSPRAIRAAESSTGTVNPFKLSAVGAECIREKAQRLNEMWAKALGGQKFESVKVKSAGRAVRIARAPTGSGAGTAAALCVEAA